jgi:hypothetical protein
VSAEEVQRVRGSEERGLKSQSVRPLTHDLLTP